MRKDRKPPNVLYSSPDHPLGAGYFLIYIGYTQGAKCSRGSQLVRLEKGWALFQPNNLTGPSPYHLLHLSTAAAWQVAANHGQALKFRTIEILVGQIVKDAPGIGPLLWELSKPFPTTWPTNIPSWGRRSYPLQ